MIIMGASRRQVACPVLPYPRGAARSPRRAGKGSPMTRALALMAVLLTGCTMPVMQKSGITQLEADRDGYQCIQESRGYRMSGLAGGGVAAVSGATEPDPQLYALCMRARGYVAVEPVQAVPAVSDPCIENDTRGDLMALAARCRAQR